MNHLLEPTIQVALVFVAMFDAMFVARACTSAGASTDKVTGLSADDIMKQAGIPNMLEGRQINLKTGGMDHNHAAGKRDVNKEQ